MERVTVTETKENHKTRQINNAGTGKILSYEEEALNLKIRGRETAVMIDHSIVLNHTWKEKNNDDIVD